VAVIPFEAAPSVPGEYPLLSALSDDEIARARLLGYVAEVDPAGSVSNDRALNYWDPIGPDDIANWRVRMFIIWFCYLFENLERLQRPMYAIEELILEFQGREILDGPNPRLATIFAGAGARDPLSAAELRDEKEFLQPYYNHAIELLRHWPLGYAAGAERAT
jgi:hypothetical protein